MSPEEIIKKRKALNLTQQQLAELIGVNKNTIYNYERGTVIPESKIVLLKKVLNVKSSDVLSNLKLSDSQKEIISDAFLFHFDEVLKIPVVKKRIEFLKLQIENEILTRKSSFNSKGD